MIAIKYVKNCIKSLVVYSYGMLDILSFKIRTIKKILSRTKENNFAQDRFFYLNHRFFLIDYEKALKTKAVRFRKKRLCDITFDLWPYFLSTEE